MYVNSKGNTFAFCCFVGVGQVLVEWVGNRRCLLDEAVRGLGRPYTRSRTVSGSGMNRCVNVIVTCVI